MGTLVQGHCDLVPPQGNSNLTCIREKVVDVGLGVPDHSPLDAQGIIHTLSRNQKSSSDWGQVNTQQEFILS